MDNWRSLRKIIHVDMDAFFAAVEQRDNPELRGKPVVVGGSPNSRGVVSTASYEARKFGLHSAMPLSEAYRLCPQVIFVPVNGAKYSAVSRQIQKIFQDYTPLVEPLSLDEAFLDVTDSMRLYNSPLAIAEEIKQRILKETELTASVGVAANKFLAKLASDLRKPDGLVVVDPDKVQEFLDPLSVSRVWGVGQKTAQRLNALNIKKIGDLRRLEQGYLAKLFGSLGNQLYQLARGIDNRPVESEKEAKSIGREITFNEDVSSRELLTKALLELAVDVGRKLRREGLRTRGVSVKLRYWDFRTTTKVKSLENPINLDEEIFDAACRLFQELSPNEPVRLIGITAQYLSHGEGGQQLAFFETAHPEKEKLARAVDGIRDKYGKHSITRARLLEKREPNPNADSW